MLVRTKWVFVFHAFFPSFRCTRLWSSAGTRIPSCVLLSRSSRSASTCSGKIRNFRQSHLKCRACLHWGHFSCLSSRTEAISPTASGVGILPVCHFSCIYIVYLKPTTASVCENTPCVRRRPAQIMERMSETGPGVSVIYLGGFGRVERALHY